LENNSTRIGWAALFDAAALLTFVLGQVIVVIRLGLHIPLIGVRPTGVFIGSSGRSMRYATRPSPEKSPDTQLSQKISNFWNQFAVIAFRQLEDGSGRLHDR